MFVCAVIFFFVNRLIFLAVVYWLVILAVVYWLVLIVINGLILFTSIFGYSPGRHHTHFGVLILHDTKPIQIPVFPISLNLSKKSHQVLTLLKAPRFGLQDPIWLLLSWWQVVATSNEPILVLCEERNLYDVTLGFFVRIVHDVRFVDNVICRHHPLCAALMWDSKFNQRLLAVAKNTHFELVNPLVVKVGA